MTKVSNSAAVRFGVFQLNLAARELSKHGVRMRISGQPLAILALLLEKPGEVVTREELRRKLWSTDTFVDFEHSLNKAVNRLRQTLGDSAEEPLYIETLPRVGYRFIAPVTESHSASDAVNAAIQQDASSPEVPRGRLLRWALYALTAIVLASGTVYLTHRWWLPPPQPQGRALLAVLPFENLSGDPEQEYVSDGLTEEMIAQLGRIDPEHLGVIARTSVMHYKHSQEQLERIGRELGVQYVLEGSVRRDAGKVRITAQLIQMRDQTHLWARQYDRELSSLLALQGEIAQEIADGIQLTLGDDHKGVAADRKPVAFPSSYEAYDLYLKGRYFWNKRTAAGFQQAVEYFQQAIAKDPNYARAYAGLADSYALMSSYNFVPQNEFMPKARAAALRALQIDDGLAEAHTSLALITENYDWDWQTAEKEYRRAIQLDPNYATVHHWYAEYLTWLGRFDEALGESERARQLDPLSLIIDADNGAILYYSRQYDRAIEKFRAVQEMEPNFPRAHMVIYAYVEKRMFAEALADIDHWRHFEDTPWTWAAAAYVYGRSGQQAQARLALAKMERVNRRRRLDPIQMLTTAYAGTDDKDEAFAWFEKAYLAHSTMLTTLKVEPVYDPLRSDPRFQNLLRRVHLAP